MADFYRGKRVSAYRKQQQSGSDVTLSLSSPVRAQVDPSSPSDRERFMKNFRGMVTIFPGDATGYNNYGCGYMGLIRWQRAETFGNNDIVLESSSFLHPVVYAMGGAPLTLIYDFKGITLGQSEVLYFVVQPTSSFGTNSVVFQFQWAQKDLVTP